MSEVTAEAVLRMAIMCRRRKVKRWRKPTNAEIAKMEEAIGPLWYSKEKWLDAAEREIEAWEKAL